MAGTVQQEMKMGKPRSARLIACFGETCLLYAGRLNEIHAEPSVGKTNVSLIAQSWLSEMAGMCSTPILRISPSAPLRPAGGTWGRHGDGY
jgi:hypothetical protein